METGEEWLDRATLKALGASTTLEEEHNERDRHWRVRRASEMATANMIPLMEDGGGILDLDESAWGHGLAMIRTMTPGRPFAEYFRPETGMERLVALVAAWCSRHGIDARLIVGVIKSGVIRLHAPPSFHRVWLEMLSTDLASLLQCEVKRGSAACFIHEDCMEDEGLGIACWLAQRNPGIPLP